MNESVLRGSSILAGIQVSRGKNRQDHYIENSISNACLDYYGSKDNNDRPEKILGERFLKYRKLWINQPDEWIVNFNDSDLVKDQYKPLCLDLELAAICDLACPYCFRQTYVTPDKVMPKKLAFELIDQASDMEIPSIKFNWRGEPLLNPHIHEIIAYAKKKGIIDTIINTNATQLTREMSIKLIDAGLDHIIYSFDGGTKKTYEKNRIGRFKQNYFEDVYKNIRQFNDIKVEKDSPFPWSKIQMILTPDTYSEQEDFINLFKDCVDEVVVNQYSERGQEIKQLSKIDIEKFEKKINRYGLPYDSPFMKLSSGEIMISKKRLPCKQPFQRMLVTYDGRVSMCCYDWGSMYTVGFVSDIDFGDLNYDKYKVKDLIEKDAKAFKDMKRAEMPPQFYTAPKRKQKLSEIWQDFSISKVRNEHANGTCDINICKQCTFKDTYDWI